jgi:hypothetical protein
MRKRFFTRSSGLRWGPFNFELNLWNVPLPHAYWGWELNRVWFGLELGGTPGDAVIGAGMAFDLPEWLNARLWKLADWWRAR